MAAAHLWIGTSAVAQRRTKPIATGSRPYSPGRSGWCEATSTQSSFISLYSTLSLIGRSRSKLPIAQNLITRSIICPARRAFRRITRRCESRTTQLTISTIAAETSTFSDITRIQRAGVTVTRAATILHPGSGDGEVRCSVRTSIVALAFTSLVALAACGTAHSTESAGAKAAAASPWASDLPPATYAGPITSPTYYPGAGIELSPPTKTAGVIAWADVYDKCSTGDALCYTGSGPKIWLANATIKDAGTARKDGTITPLLSNTLVYVMSWTGVPCTRLGGPPSRSTPSAPRTGARCTILNLISSQTGSVVYSTEGSGVLATSSTTPPASLPRSVATLKPSAG